MLALLVAGRLPKLLVPSDVLRGQIIEKFVRLGVLHGLGIVVPRAQRPVGRISSGFRSVEQAAAFARACNVIVTTPNAHVVSLGVFVAGEGEEGAEAVDVAFVSDGEPVVAERFLATADSAPAAALSSRAANRRFVPHFRPPYERVPGRSIPRSRDVLLGDLAATLRCEQHRWVSRR